MRKGKGERGKEKRKRKGEWKMGKRKAKANGLVALSVGQRPTKELRSFAQFASFAFLNLKSEIWNLESEIRNLKSDI